MKRTNANYNILATKRINPETEIALGYNPISELYVCWTCYYGIDFRAGVYSDDVVEVLCEFCKRAS